jgi:succinoglycan biosynthesis protein ExoO
MGANVVSFELSDACKGRLTMAKEPTVSAVIPTFNTRDCVRAAIDSALNQEGVDVEVIVVDDASKDGTADLVAQAYGADARVKVIRREKNGGPSAARNIGFRAASGTWIGLLDADDLWQPDRLARLLHRGDEADFIADNIMGYDVVAGAFTGPIYKGLGDRPLHLIDFILPSAADRHDFGYLQPLLRRSFLTQHNIAYREDVRVGEDLIFNLEILSRGGRAFYVDDPLYVYAMPVGLISRAASPYSRSTADTEPLKAALAELWHRIEDTLSPAESEAFSLRLDSLTREAAIAAFHRARAKSDYLQMARLFASKPAVREKIGERLRASWLRGRP